MVKLFPPPKFALKDKHLLATQDYNYSDGELARMVARGDRQAFTALLHRFWNKVYTQSLTWLKSAEDAQEMTQDVFVVIWQERQKLNEVESLSAWLSTITRYRVISELRKKRARILELQEGTAVTGFEVEERFDFRESESLIRKGLDKLPPARKKVFLMSRMENKTYEEIAAELHISRNGVKDHIVKALNSLREFMAKHGGDTSLAIFMIVDFLKKKS